MTVDLAEIRFRHAVEQLHRLGARPVAELLVELGARYLIRHPIETLVTSYLDRLDPRVVRALGADRLPPVPLRLTRGDREPRP
jgi:hypothetical protein